MTIADVMTVFRQIIGVIARIKQDANTAGVKVEYIAQDMGVDIADMRVWLLLMKAIWLIVYDQDRDAVLLNRGYLDSLGFDLQNLEVG